MKKLSGFVAFITLVSGPVAFAQRSSLYVDPLPAPVQPASPQGPAADFRSAWEVPAGPGVGGQPVAPAAANPAAMAANPLAAASWIYTPQPPPRVLQIHDLVHVRVDETAQTSASGSAQSRKNSALDLDLTDWVRFEGLDTLKPATQSDGDLSVAGQNAEIYRADSTLRTRESITFNITAEIADIRPNGLLVLSATKEIRDNDNVWELSFSGICRPEDIGPDNVVLSRDIFDPRIVKNEDGHVREGYARGWFTRLYGKFKPF